MVVYSSGYLYKQVAAQHGKSLRVQAVRQDIQAVVDAFDSSAHPFGHAALSVPVLR